MAAEGERSTSRFIPSGLRFQFPEFHGDIGKYPHESWELYLIGVELAYKGYPKDAFDDEAKKAHLLSGLKGPARKYLTVNRTLMDLPLDKVLLTLEERFNRASVTDFVNISDVIQQPGELVIEFSARLQEAARVIRKDKFIPVIPMIKTELKKESDSAADGEGDTVEIDSNKLKTKKEKDEANRMHDEFLDAVLFPHFCRGLRPEFLAAISAAQPRTFKEALRVAEDKEKYMELYGGRSRRAHFSANVVMDTPDYPKEFRDPEVATASRQLQALQQPSGVQFEQPPFERARFDRPNSDPTGRETRTCFYCKKPGHILRDCRIKTRDLQQQRMSTASNGHTQTFVSPRMSDMPSEGRNPTRPESSRQSRQPTRGNQRTYDGFVYDTPPGSRTRNPNLQTFNNKPRFNASHVPENSKNGERPPRGGHATRMSQKNSFPNARSRPQ